MSEMPKLPEHAKMRAFHGGYPDEPPHALEPIAAVVDDPYYKARHSILAAARYLKDLALGNYEGVRQGVCRTDVLVMALRDSATYFAAARRENETAKRLAAAVLRYFDPNRHSAIRDAFGYEQSAGESRELKDEMLRLSAALAAAQEKR